MSSNLESPKYSCAKIMWSKPPQMESQFGNEAKRGPKGWKENVIQKFESQQNLKSYNTYVHEKLSKVIGTFNI